MWNKIQYALIYSWVKVHALLPMWALYILSDILYVLVYKVVRYRVKVVRQNMKASFPDKSDTELRRLEREFYHHFTDYVVETIKLAHISLEELQRRAFLKNPELVDTLMEKGHTCFILLMGHYGNWEWFSGSTSRFKDSRIYQIYRPLNNLHYWTNFLNQDSSILTGPERLARKLDLPVIFLDTKQVKRGYYTIDMKLVTETPKETPENWITEQLSLIHI